MPAFKKDDKSSPSNYRPISLLSCIGKVMERAVYKYTYNFIFEHSLLYAYQSGFIRGHSTVYQLLEMYHRVCQNLDERLSTILIFCDIQKLLTSQFASSQSFSQSMTMRCRQQTVSPNCLSYL
jgi:hypothetical protein